MRIPAMAGDRFKHLLGRGSSKPAGARAEDEDEDDKKKRDGKKSKAEDDEDKKDDKKRDGKKAEDDDEKKRDDKAEGKKAEDEDDEDADEEDDEDEDDKEKNRDAKAIRQAERARCAAIFAHPSAAARPDFAAHLAFETGMSARSAKAMLASYAGSAPPAPAARERLGKRVEANPVVGASSDGSADEKKPHERLLAARAAMGRK